MREQLESHLEPLRRVGLIVSWHDGNILPGANWEQEILYNISTADIILLLMSQYFISSDYCYTKEMQIALERRKNGNAEVIPIILRPVEWKVTPLGPIQALPDEGKPIMLWRNRDKAFYNTVQGIKRAIEVILAKAGPFCVISQDGRTRHLHACKVTLRGGRRQIIFYFAPIRRWNGNTE